MKEFSSLRYAKRTELPGCRQAWLILVASCCLCASPLAQADSGWLWLDSSGHKVYSDMPPPPGVPLKSILQQPESMSQGAVLPSAQPLPSRLPEKAAPAAGKPDKGSSPASAAGDKARAETPSLSDEELRAAIEKRNAAIVKGNAEIEKHNAEIRQMNCRRAREGLAALASGLRLLAIDERGELVANDENRRAAEQRRLQLVEQENCQP